VFQLGLPAVFCLVTMSIVCLKRVAHNLATASTVAMSPPRTGIFVSDDLDLAPQIPEPKDNDVA